MKKDIFIFQLFWIVFIVFGCKSVSTNKMTEYKTLNMNNFDTVLEDKRITMHTLSNHNGMQVFITNYGARIVGICVPDKNGTPVDVVLGLNRSGSILNLPIHILDLV